MERGIITPAMEIVSQGPSISMKGGIPPEKCRYYALYWDKVVVTDSNIFGTGLSDDLNALHDAGILRKETARMALNGTFDGGDLAHMHFEGLAQVADNLIQKNPGQWVIHQTGDVLNIPKDSSRELVTADIELAKCLPVPRADYPLDKLLDFKLRRANELIALRSTLDELYLEIAKSSDIPRAKIAQIQRFETALKDLDKVAQQSWGERILASRKVSLDLNYGAVMNGAITAGLVGTSFSSPLAGAALGAAHSLTSSLKFEVSLSNQLASAEGNQLNLSYLGSLKEEDVVK